VILALTHLVFRLSDRLFDLALRIDNHTQARNR